MSCSWCGAGTLRTKMSSKRLKAALVEVVYRHGLEDCSRRTDQQWQKAGGRTCRVGNVVRAVWISLSGTE